MYWRSGNCAACADAPFLLVHEEFCPRGLRHDQNSVYWCAQSSAGRRQSQANVGVKSRAWACPMTRLYVLHVSLRTRSLSPVNTAICMI